MSQPRAGWATVAVSGAVVALGAGFALGRATADTDSPTGEVGAPADIGFELDVQPWGRIDACPTHPNPASPPTSHCPTVAHLDPAGDQLHSYELPAEASTASQMAAAEEYCQAFIQGGGFYCQPNGDGLSVYLSDGPPFAP